MARLRQELSDEEEAYSEERQIQFEKERRVTEEEKKLKDKEVESLEHKIKSAKLKRELSTSFDEDYRFQRINGVMKSTGQFTSQLNHEEWLCLSLEARTFIVDIDTARFQG